MENPDFKLYVPGLRKSLALSMLSLSDVQPGTLMFRLKLKAEDLYAKTWEDDPAGFLYAKLLSVDSRLDEVESLLCKPESKSAYDEAFNAVDQGLKRSLEDFNKLASKEGRAITVKEKIEMQTARFEQAKRVALLCVAPPAPANSLENSSSTSTSGVLTSTSTSRTLIPTSTSPNSGSGTQDAGRGTVNPPVTTNPPANNPPVTNAQTTQTDLGLVRIELYAQPNPANVGDAVKMYVKGIKVDGSAIDVTSYAKFSQVGALGTFNGATYSASKAGSVTLIADVTSGSQTFSARANLQINQSAVSVSRIEVTVVSGGLNVYLGQTRTLKVTAYYTNGFTADVTRSVTWNLSNNLGSISGTTFTAGNQTGSVAATATYTEAGVTKEGQISFQIIQASATGAMN